MLLPAFDNKIEEFVHEMAVKYNLSNKDVREIIDSPFRFIKETIKEYKEGNPHIFYIYGLGSFKLKKIYVRSKKQPSCGEAGISINTSI